ncbi:MAG: hypothetical protein ACREX8_00890, partial [Gammaproteobacteria bacterium]
DLNTRRAVAELQRAARSNAAQSATVDSLVFGLFGSAGNTARPVAMVKRSTGGNPANATDTIETFDTTILDTDSMFDPTVGNRLTVQTPGIYIAAAQVPYTGNGTGYRVLDILALGTHPVNNVIGANSDAGIAGGLNLMQALSAPTPFDAGDELFMNLYQNSGGPLATLTTYGGCWLAAIYLQPPP